MLPKIHLELIDLEVEQRQELALNNLAGFEEPIGFEYRFEAYDLIGSMVCSGKLDRIPGLSVNIRQIETVGIHRRKGYASATVWALIRHFHLLITPVEERGLGVRFWQAMRNRYLAQGLIRDQISVTDANSLLDSFYRSHGRSA